MAASAATAAQRPRHRDPLNRLRSSATETAAASAASVRGNIGAQRAARTAREASPEVLIAETRTVLSNVGVCPSFDCHSTRWCLGRGWLSTPDNQSIRWCSEWVAENCVNTAADVRWIAHTGHRSDITRTDEQHRSTPCEAV